MTGPLCLKFTWGDSVLFIGDQALFIGWRRVLGQFKGGWRFCQGDERGNVQSFITKILRPASRHQPGGKLNSVRVVRYSEEPAIFPCITGVDFHWYVMNQDGTWSHKPGQTPAIDVDNNGAAIRDVETCAMGGYRFVTFMKSHAHVITIWWQRGRFSHCLTL